MDGPDYPQPEPRGTPPEKSGRVPSLIHDYRTQRDAWREQARNLARMREEVLQAADREAQDIVTSARASIREILLKARRDLLVLAAQVRAAGRLGDGEDTPDVTFLPGEDFDQAHGALTTARQDIRRVLDESRPELEGLVAEGEALRSALRPPSPRPVAPTPIEQRRQFTPAPFDNLPTRPEPAVDFEFATVAASESEEFAIRKRPPVRSFIAAVATLGTIAVMGTTWWLYRPASKPQPSTADSKPIDPKSSPSVNASASGVKRAATTNTSAGARSESDGWMRRSPIPDPRSPIQVSLGLSARRASWVRVTVDGRVTTERTLKAGETQLVSGTREISIRAGDAGALMVSVSGRQPVALGREGEVVTRRFGTETPRVTPAAPAPPVTPRPNPQVPIAQAAPGRPPANTNVPTSTASANPPRVTPQQTAAVSPPAPTSTPAVPPAATTTPPRPSTIALDRQPAATTPATSAPPPQAPASPQVSLQNTLANEASRFLDAYYRQDRATMASISTQVNVNDDRPEKERMPRGLTGVRRTLDDVNLQVSGPVALLTARMTERMENLSAGQSAQAVSYVSQMWTQSNGTWLLQDVKIVSAATIGRALR